MELRIGIGIWNSEFRTHNLQLTIWYSDFELRIDICTYLEADFYLKLEVLLEQLDVLSPRVELKLRHWPNTAHYFIARLTNQRPVFFHS